MSRPRTGGAGGDVSAVRLFHAAGGTSIVNELMQRGRRSPHATRLISESCGGLLVEAIPHQT